MKGDKKLSQGSIYFDFEEGGNVRRAHHFSVRLLLLELEMKVSMVRVDVTLKLGRINSLFG